MYHGISRRELMKSALLASALAPRVRPDREEFLGG
jgi:hypothetical protein